MSRPITLEEVVTYANALIVQYVEKKGVTELPPQIASLKITDSEGSQVLPTLIGKEQKFDTVLENIIHQHLSRAFDDREVHASSPLITIQKGTSIPARRTSQRQSLGRFSSLSLPDVSDSPKSITTPTKRSKRPSNISSDEFKTPTKEEFSSPDRRKSCKSSSFRRRRITQCRRDERPQTAPVGAFTHSASRNGKSRESWIPDHIREKMVQRDLTVAKRNLEFNDMYDRSSFVASEEGEGMSPFERNLTKEKFGLASRKACGLCCRQFLPINLIMAVPLKAIFDMRDTWGAKFDPEGSKSRIVNVNPNLKRAPACYDRTRVCAFCAQLFDNQQEIYRPSFETKEAEKEHANEVERERTHAIMSDPLKRMDDERAHKILDTETAAKTDVIACKS